METEIEIIIQCNEDKKEIILPLLKACHDWVKDDIILHAKKLGDESFSQMNELIKEYDDYLCGIEVGGKKNIIIRTTCGSSGEEFLIKMMEAFAPHATKMNGNFEHDEDPEPPVKYRLFKGKIVKSIEKATKKKPAKQKIDDDPVIFINDDINKFKKITINHLNIKKIFHSILKHNARNILHYVYDQGLSFDSQDASGNSLFATSIIHNNIELAENLLSKGADPNIVIKIDEFGDEEIGQIELDFEGLSDTEIIVKDRQEKFDIAEIATPAACWAANEGNLEMLKILDRYEADFSLTDAEGFSPLIFSVYSNDANCVSFFLKKGFSPNIKDSDDTWLIHEAVYRGNIDIVEKLCEYGVDLSVKGDGDETVLGVASEAVRFFGTDILSILIEAGADIDAPDEDGETPLMLCLFLNSYNAAEILLKAGADLGLRNADEESAMDYAEDEGEKFVQLIKAYADGKQS